MNMELMSNSQIAELLAVLRMIVVSEFGTQLELYCTGYVEGSSFECKIVFEKCRQINISVHDDALFSDLSSDCKREDDIAGAELGEDGYRKPAIFTGFSIEISVLFKSCRFLTSWLPEPNVPRNSY